MRRLGMIWVGVFMVIMPFAWASDKGVVPPDTSSVVVSYPDAMGTDINFVRIVALAKGLTEGHLEVATPEMKQFLKPLPWVWKPYLAFIICATISGALIEVANFHSVLSWYVPFLAASLIATMAGQFAFGLIFQKGVDARDDRQDGFAMLEEMYKGIGMTCLRVLVDSLLLAISKEQYYPDFMQKDVESGLGDEADWLDTHRGKDLEAYPSVHMVLQLLNNIAEVREKLIGFGLSSTRATKVCMSLTHVRNNFVPGTALWVNFASAVAEGDTVHNLSAFVGAQSLIEDSMVVALRGGLAAAALMRSRGG